MPTRREGAPRALGDPWHLNSRTAIESPTRPTGRTRCPASPRTGRLVRWMARSTSSIARSGCTSCGALRAVRRTRRRRRTRPWCSPPTRSRTGSVSPALRTPTAAGSVRGAAAARCRDSGHHRRGPGSRCPEGSAAIAGECRRGRARTRSPDAWPDGRGDLAHGCCTARATRPRLRRRAPRPCRRGPRHRHVAAGRPDRESRRAACSSSIARS